jgi:glycogen operon protein
MGRTQQGNNNAYCQDNELSWVSWKLSDADRALLEFTRRVARLRREHPSFRRRKFFRGRPIRGSEAKDVTWLRADGHEMTDQEWNSGFIRCFGMCLGGDAMEEWDDQGRQISDDTFLILMNADGGSIGFTLPDCGGTEAWEVTLDTSEPELREGERRLRVGASLMMEGRSMIVLRAVDDPDIFSAGGAGG